MPLLAKTEDSTLVFSIHAPQAKQSRTVSSLRGPVATGWPDLMSNRAFAMLAYRLPT